MPTARAPDMRDRFGADLTLDGGLASELERRGADLRDGLWSARLLRDDPGLIRQVHLDFFAAGADVAISASYQASYEGFAAAGIERTEAAALMRRSVDLARDAAELAVPGRIVAASVGPYGAMRADGSEYDGRYGAPLEDLVAFHRPRIATLLEAGPDVLAVETIPSILEAEAIVAVLEEHPEALAWVSFSCRDGERISDGTPFAEAAALAASSDRVIAVGVNCTPPAFVPELLGRARIGTPLLAYPNLGSTWDAAAKTWQAVGRRPDFGAEAARWRDAGARIVGGCCGTTPGDIAAIVATR
jgi:homocysteine S-methyltransferase